MPTVKAIAVLLILIMQVPIVHADQMPDQMVHDNTHKIQELLRKNMKSYKKDKTTLYTMVYENILPFFDFKAMSRLVLARNWRTANDHQRVHFANEFKDLLVRTYSTALLKYTNDEILYLPFRGKPGDKRVEVKIEIKPSGGGPKLPMVYKFYKKTPESDWKVYDVLIEGISLVTNYRNVYADRVRKDGLDALIASLAKNNTQTVSND